MGYDYHNGDTRKYGNSNLFRRLDKDNITSQSTVSIVIGTGNICRDNIRRARTYQALPNNSIIKIKDIEIDPHSHMVQRKGVTIDLTPIEFQILYILASHPGQAYSKERLYELIWKEPYFGNENVMNTHINRLRLKLKSNAEDSTAYVKTLWGIGYKMEEK